jgi:hypothetical protein
MLAIKQKSTGERQLLLKYIPGTDILDIELLRV